MGFYREKLQAKWRTFQLAMELIAGRYGGLLGDLFLLPFVGVITMDDQNQQKMSPGVVGWNMI